MLFSSYKFVFVFLPVVLAMFTLARLFSARAATIVLVVASLFFYASWKHVYLLLLLASLVFNFTIGLLMERSAKPRIWAAAGVTVNLLVLCYFKYAMFALDNINALAGTHIWLGQIVLPIGISFFTFQQIAYLVDVKRGAPTEHDAVSFTLFVCFFPHLIAGPLVHHAEMIPQFKRMNRRVTRLLLLATRGVVIAITGLFKKAVIADSFAQFATPAFAHVDGGGTIGTASAWIATLAYALQIYFDFSGYSDMAIGFALMFGIRLPVNFRSPYKSRSIIEFWRRWHITLSRFLRDYLYIPLGGNRHGKGRRYINLMVTMLLGGLWHGAGWNFVIWGAIHGTALAVANGWRDLAKLSGRSKRLALLPQRARDALTWTATFAVVLFGWAFFRAATTAGAWTMVCAMAGFAPSGAPYAPVDLFRFGDLPWAMTGPFRLIVPAAAITAGLLVVLMLPNTPEVFRYREYRRGPQSRRVAWGWRLSPPWAVVMATAFALSIVAMSQSLEFLYFQF